MLLAGKWISVADYNDRMSADAIVGLLEAAGVTSRIVSNEHIPGLGTAFSVRVPPELVEAANVALAGSRVSEAELTDLAMQSPRDESSRDES
jgi:hypothetical protein